ncbi:MAG: hypothetical protein WCB68_03940 [Pyrinomonadaceae bacterium]
MTRRNIINLVLLVSIFSLLSINVCAQSTDRGQIEKEFKALSDKLDAKFKELLAVSAEDRATYADFLKQPESGIFRLMPREKFDFKGTTMRGGGAYYSFTKLKHEYGYGSDIELEQDRFSVGFAGLDFGMIVSLGDVPIENVTLEHAGVPFLATYAAPTVEAEIREQQNRVGVGFKADDFNYKGYQPAVVNTTYALRSISYGSNNGTDVLVALRPVRKDSDGSMIVLWKMLKKFPAPQWKRNQTAQTVK